MFPKCPHLFIRTTALLLLLGFCGQGLRWELAQATAWSRMIQDFRSTESWAGAISKTFSGKAPCPSCTQLAKEKTSGRSDGHAWRDHSEELYPPGLFASAPRFVPPFPIRLIGHHLYPLFISTLRMAPPRPPPKRS
jgi:hypothetical protein